MSKTYILIKEITHPGGTCPIGTVSLYEDDYYIFPYFGMSKTDENGWLGSAYMFHKDFMQSEGMKQWVKEIDAAQAEKMEHFNMIRKANLEGYAGCLPNGNLVDRRTHPKAYPVAQNPMFNITPPRCIKCGQITDIGKLLESVCPECNKPK